jgi:hypothetical protein
LRRVTITRRQLYQYTFNSSQTSRNGFNATLKRKFSTNNNNKQQQQKQQQQHQQQQQKQKIIIIITTTTTTAANYNNNCIAHLSNLWINHSVPLEFQQLLKHVCLLFEFLKLFNSRIKQLFLASNCMMFRSDNNNDKFSKKPWQVQIQAFLPVSQAIPPQLHLSAQV